MNSSLNKAASTTPEQLSALLNGRFLGELGFKAIACPSSLLPIVGLGKGDVMRCFVSMNEPEDLLAPLSAQIKPLAEVEMGWRQDIGVWSSTYKMKASEQTFGMNLEAPGQSESMRTDPAVNRYRAVLSYIISAPPNAT